MSREAETKDKEERSPYYNGSWTAFQPLLPCPWKAQLPYVAKVHQHPDNKSIFIPPTSFLNYLLVSVACNQMNPLLDP